VEARPWIELMLAASLPISIGGVIWHRVSGDRGLSARSIQFMAVTMLIPTIGILALEKIIEGATVGTLIGGLTGYLLSGISNYDKQTGTP
jgi:hypothetical protein